MNNHLVFEDTTSALYYSNDARLHVVRQGSPELLWTVVEVADEVVAPGIDRIAASPVVFASRDRVKVDAYIAGYDLATREAFKAKINAALTA
jgi:hypothetical protein